MNRLSYASHFVSFLLDLLKGKENIKNIILFGSVSRAEETSESDVDIFIDIKKSSKKLESDVKKIVDLFYQSKDALLFKSKGIDNKINVVVGKLNEWDKIKSGIESSGLVLYGPYISTAISGKKSILISWDNISINRGAFLNKLYGYKIGEKRYAGMIELFNGKKIGKSSALIPIENSKEVLDLIKRHKVNASLLEVYA